MSSLHEFGAVRARTRKGPILREDSSKHDGRGVRPSRATPRHPPRTAKIRAGLLAPDCVRTPRGLDGRGDAAVIQSRRQPLAGRGCGRICLLANPNAGARDPRARRGCAGRARSALQRAGPRAKLEERLALGWGMRLSAETRLPGRFAPDRRRGPALGEAPRQQAPACRALTWTQLL